MLIQYDSEKTHKNLKKKVKLRNDYDYIIFRQDFDGAEIIYFNENEIDQVIEDIGTGKINIHRNYSILFTAKSDKLNKVSDIDGNTIFGCYGTLKQYAEGE